MRQFLAWLLLGCLCVSLPVAAERVPDVTLTGTMTGADHETYRELPFEMPAGVVRLTVEFSYTGRQEKTTIDLGLRDPVRLRGWSGGNKNRFVVEASDATPSYLPGPLPPGTWKILLGVPNIRTTSTADFTVKVWFDRADAAFPGYLPAPINPKAGWYRGDLHMHTAHSDGACNSTKGITVPCPVFKTLEAASARHLDFIAVTDHNGTAQNQSLRELAPYFDDLLLIPGREITTFKGHANVFGPTSFLDYQLGSEHAPTIATIVDEVKAAQGLISINHPGAPSGEVCMGCGWRAMDTDFSRVDAIEAVNGGTVNNTGSPEGQYASIPFWEEQLNAGVHITAIGGSDNHDATSPPNEASSIGVPTTVVHASELSQAAVLEGIRKGHVFVDVWGSPAGLLEMEAEADGQHAEMGDVLTAGNRTHVRLSVHIAGVPPDSIVVWAGNGAKLLVAATPSKGRRGATAAGRGVGAVGRGAGAGPGAQPNSQVGTSAAPGIRGGGNRQIFELIADGRPHWLRADVRGADGKLLLLGNPIYLRSR
jgi:hypothetical protein